MHVDTKYTWFHKSNSGLLLFITMYAYYRKPVNPRGVRTVRMIEVVSDDFKKDRISHLKEIKNVLT